MRNKFLLRLGLILLPFITALICMGIGRYSMNVTQTAKVLFSPFFNYAISPAEYSVIFNVRLPRILLAASVGAGLSCAGVAFQGLFTNPMATPDTLGVASGASFGAVLVMMFKGNLILVQLSALLMGIFSCLLVYTIGKTKKGNNVVMLILGGMVISALFQALVSLLKYIADPEDQLPAITYWLMGSMASITYKTLAIGVPFIILGMVIIFALRWRLNILSLSEDEVKSLGINLKVLRGVFILASSLITASCVSMCGQVGWVGLLIPHIARMLSGSNNKKVVPVSISLGTIFMIVIDTFARSFSAAEIPISILTAVIGAPFFIMLMKKTGGAWS